MTVSTTNRKAGPFTGNGVTTVFPFVFRMFSTADLVVVRAVAGVETTLTLGVDYTAILNADQDGSPGGQITLGAPLASGAMMVITSALPATQLVQVTNGGGFFPAVFNAVFDRLTILVQQVIETTGRNLTFAVTDDASGIGTLPALAGRKGTVLQFNSTTGKPEAGPVSSAIGASVTASQAAAAAALSSANDAAAALASTLSAFDNFDDRYLGAKTAAPALDNDGNAIIGGALYFDTGAVTPANKGMWVNDGTGLSGWFPAYTNSTLYLAKAGGTMSGAINEAPVATVASAATTAIGAATANTVSITGTATITAFDTVASGIGRKGYFTGAATLANSANLILPGAANIVAAAGDCFEAVSMGAGIWRILDYQKANGAAVSAATASLPRVVQATTYTALASDNSKILELSAATAQTLNLTAAATLGVGWSCWWINTGVGTWTVDPNGAELVDGVASYAILPGEARLLTCDGAAFKTLIVKPFFLTMTASGTFPVLAPGYASVSGLLWSSGAGGRKGNGAPVSPGGACVPFSLLRAKLTAAQTVTIGASVAGSANSNFTAGNNSTFGALVTTYAPAGTVAFATAQGPDTGGAIAVASAGGDVYSGGNASWPNAIYGGAAGGYSGVTNPTSVFAGDGGAYVAAANGGNGVAPAGAGGAADTGFTPGAGARGELRCWGVPG